MAVYNLGSINADLVYRVPHLPAAGETLAAQSFDRGLGGKGANMSVALARAGSTTHHIGAVGQDGAWMVDRMAAYGVDTTSVANLPAPSGHAVIWVDDAGENSIILFPGTNHMIDEGTIAQVLDHANSGDFLIFQNETNGIEYTAELARNHGMQVAYAAAPFDTKSVQILLPLIDYLFMNEIEAAQLEQATGISVENLPVTNVVVTLGAKGACWYDTQAKTQTRIPAIPVTPVDTTGAGDTFTGYVIAGLDQGMSMKDALTLAAKAGALMVTRHGAADAIPTLEEVRAFGALTASRKGGRAP